MGKGYSVTIEKSGQPPTFVANAPSSEAAARGAVEMHITIGQANWSRGVVSVRSINDDFSNGPAITFDVKVTKIAGVGGASSAKGSDFGINLTEKK